MNKPINQPNKEKTQIRKKNMKVVFHVGQSLSELHGLELLVTRGSWMWACLHSNTAVGSAAGFQLFRFHIF